MKKFATVAAGALLALGVASSANAATRVGMLRCHVHGGASYIVGSTHQAKCVFTSVSGRREHYVGKVERLGFDIGYTGGALLTWSVFAPSFVGPHALAGDYVGASADIAAGVGGGANVLVGGNGGTVSLQPLSLQSEKGLTIGAGAGALLLR